MNKALVTGTGFLGARLVDVLDALDYRVACCDLAPSALVPRKSFRAVNITDPDAVDKAVRGARPDVVFHTAAMTDVLVCEREPELARRVNVDGARNVGQSCARSNIPMVHLSTDLVFDGRKGSPYREDDVPNPVSVYGRTKFDGELALKDLSLECAVVRASALFGGDDAPTNIGRRVVDALAAGRIVRAARDITCSPLLVDSLASALARIHERGAWETLHIAGTPPMSRHAFALAVAREFSLPEKLVEPATAAQLGRAALWPCDSSLDPSRAAKALGLDRLSVDDGLARMRSQMEAQGWKAPGLDG